jgi:hypothetical protein
MFCPMRPTMSRLDTAPANGGSNRLHHRSSKSGITPFHVRRDKAALNEMTTTLNDAYSFTLVATPTPIQALTASIRRLPPV